MSMMQCRERLDKDRRIDRKEVIGAMAELAASALLCFRVSGIRNVKGSKRRDGVTTVAKSTSETLTAVFTLVILA
jgi:hypothetical protein